MIRRTLIVTLMLILSSALCRAENDTIVHNFDALVEASRLKFTNSNHTGTVDGEWVYTCAEGAVFENNPFLDPNISADMHKKGVGLSERVIISPAIENLIGVIVYYRSAAKSTSYMIQISTDGSEWSDAEAEYSNLNEISNATITASFSSGTYYVRVRNQDKTYDMSMYEIRYIIEEESNECNCFRYVGE